MAERLGSGARVQDWVSPGPVSSAFCASSEPVSVLMGPAAGGKTVTGLMRGVLRAWSWPETLPGLRRVRFSVVRQLMVDLERTTIPSWNQWFPRSMGEWEGSRNGPQSHRLVLRHPVDGGRVELQVEFRGIGDKTVEASLKGWEPSYVFVDECDLLAPGDMAWLFLRAGRYPKETIDINPRQIWGCCNAPEPDNWVMRDFIENPIPGWRLYSQPSGLSPAAENLRILGRDHYKNQALSMPPFLRKRYIENIPGVSMDAAAVYVEMNPDMHVSPEVLSVIPGRPLLVGLDAGGTPAASFWQLAANGQRRCLGELSTHAREHGSITGPTRFGEALREMLAGRFRGVGEIRVLADPSAQWGADTAGGEGSWIDIVSRVSGVRVWPAPTNDPTLRIEALRWPMGQLIDGRHPGLLVCPSCVLTVRGLTREYRYSVIGGRVGARPLKNWASHLIEAAQYALLDGSAFYEIQSRGRRERASVSARVAQTDFNPFV